MNCLRCGFANAAGNRFCGRCGESLEPLPPDDGERRPITFVMCDLVGSTQLAQALDLDDWHALLGDYHTLCGDALRRHDGHAAQVLGDGVLFYFGWPHAHEDDARRAVQCGLDILDALQARNRSPARAVDMELHVRIGVHTGRAVVSTVRVGPHHEHLAQGDAPNIAARVQSVAPADALVASEATWRLVRHHFHGDDLGPHELKGVAQPVALWRVVAARAPSPHFQPEATLTAYVGRQAELDALAQHWQAARAGTARFVVLSGDAGIGKSRLVEEFRRRLAGEDQQVFDLRCTPYAQTSAFLPVTQLLAECLGLERTQPPPERLERLERGLAAWDIAAPDAVPLLAELLSIPCDSRHPAPELSPARRRTRMLEILVAALQRMAAARPTLLIAEDLHWADPSTVDLLQLVVSSVSRLRLLGLFTARTEFRPPWPAGETAPTLQLSRLTDEEVEAVVHDVAHGKRVPGELSREIAQRCDGVPLFVEEMMRAVIEAGAMREGAHAWELTAPLGHALIPPSIDASLMARIDRLGDARATAQLGAAIGREFTHALIRSVSDRGEDELAQDLRRIIDAGLLWKAGTGDQALYLFKHALVRDAAYASLVRSRRQAYHARIAEGLRTHFREIAAEQPELVAQHLAGAGRDAEAVGFWETAGKRAAARTAMREAASHFQHAIECLGRLPATDERLGRELDLQNEIAPVLMTVHGWGAQHVRQACERARELATRLARFDKIYPAVWGLWTYHFLRGEMDDAARAAPEALAMARASGVPLIQVTGRHATAYTHLYRGEFAAALQEADAGLALFDLEQERALAATFQLSSSVALRTARATALWMLGEADEAARERARMVELGRTLGHTPSRAAALAFELHSGLGFALGGQGFDELLRVADALCGLARDEGFVLWHAVATTYRGAALALRGVRDEAESQMEDGLAAFVETGARLTLVPMSALCARGYMHLDRPERAERLLEAAQAEADARNERMWEPEVDRTLAALRLRRGDAAGAERALRSALAKARRQRAAALVRWIEVDLQRLPAPAHD